MTDTPRVSVAIRASRERWLREAIASVLSQSFRDLELVVYDDAGDLQDIVAEFDDPRVRYHRAGAKLGPSGRFNAAAALCRGEYVGVLDDDDYYGVHFVERMLGAFEAAPQIGVAFCRFDLDADGQLFATHERRAPGVQREIIRELLRHYPWLISPSNMLIRLTALQAADGLQLMPDNVLPHVFVNVRVALAGWELFFLDEILITRRWHAGQLSQNPLWGFDLAVATFQQVQVTSPHLETFRRHGLARYFLARAFHKLVANRRAEALADIRAAGAANVKGLWFLYSVLAAAAAIPFLGPWAARCVKTLRYRPPSGLAPWLWRRISLRKKTPKVG